MKQRCPKCGSDQIEIYDDLALIKCKKCGYDELGSEPLPYDVRKSQREKTKYSPYKTGGKSRTRKK